MARSGDRRRGVGIDGAAWGRCERRRAYLITAARASARRIAGQTPARNYTRRASSRVHESRKLRGRCKIRAELLFRSTVTHKFASMLSLRSPAVLSGRTSNAEPGTADSVTFFFPFRFLFTLQIVVGTRGYMYARGSQCGDSFCWLWQSRDGEKFVEDIT